MGTDNIMKILTDFEQKIIKIDFDKLPISDYNKKYIADLKSANNYYINIYALVRIVVNSISPLKEEELVMVDYGGGCGFFSILMKMFGVHKVIYIDRNPNSVKTVEEVSKAFGTGPDVIICGDSPELVAWCRDNHVKPHLVVGLDVIEHIYNLRHFFADISSLGQNLGLVFMTGSNPMNFWKCRKLKKEMDAYEKGKAVTPNYYTKRLEFIKQNHPDMEESKAHEYAAITRGMNYEDIRYFIKSNNYSGTGAATLTGYQDEHNTCDPETGNYMERILPLEEYCLYLSDKKDGLFLIQVGFYNPFGKNKLKNRCARIANKLIMSTGTWGIRIAPFIIMASIRNRTEE
ncbi:MAG: hypothetical protein EGQ00_04940 [Parabacteroides johnsonii]|nr:hypothetical protein [Parabacteroides johnsonii]